MPLQIQKKVTKNGDLNITNEITYESHINVEEESNKEVEASKGLDIKSRKSKKKIKRENLDISEKIKNEFRIDVQGSAGQSLEYFLEKKLAALPDDDFNFGYIFKVSEKYRKLNEDSYTPRVVSIGPIHCGKTHLQGMEGYKLRCLNILKNNFGINLNKLSEFATARESFVRTFYQDFEFNAKEFSHMILLDGIFIILLIAMDKGHISEELFKLPLFDNSWMASDVKHDMLLLENQLPLCFILELLQILKPDYYNSFGPDLVHYFKDVGNTHRLIGRPVTCENKLHLVDFLLALHIPSRPKKRSLSGRIIHARSTSELRAAGVRFMPLDAELLAVNFFKLSGKLWIPKLTVNATTETFFRNLIAFEQSQHLKYITSYIIFMDSIIDTAEDVRLLVKYDIIKNSLGENQLVADLFNNLHKEVLEDPSHFYYTRICNDLNEYSKDCIHLCRSDCFKWKLILKNKYFSNPWSVISFIAATILVILAIVQTVCAVVELTH